MTIDACKGIRLKPELSKWATIKFYTPRNEFETRIVLNKSACYVSRFMITAEVYHANFSVCLLHVYSKVHGRWQDPLVPTLHDWFSQPSSSFYDHAECPPCLNMVCPYLLRCPYLFIYQSYHYNLLWSIVHNSHSAYA